MSTETQPEAAPPAKSKKLLLIAVIVLGVVIGGGAGAFVAAPLLAGRVPPTAADSAAKGEEQAGKAKGGKESAKVVHVVDNMVLNPAGSGGARFLLLSVGLAVKDEATVKTLSDRDPELRDVVLRFMGARTIEELADVGLRDSLKAQLRTAVGERFGAGTVIDVYFPQFVIQ
ncbi:MAG TPA: flagellar basal body-associated FliL family protein [Gemmatimonadales bacterium]